MSYISRHFRVLSLGEIIRRVKAGSVIEPFTIAITFDDGYRDNWLYAAPILKKHGLPATLFVASGFLGTDRLMWNDQVALAVKHTKKSNYHFNVDGKKLDVEFSTIRERLQFVNDVIDKMKRLSDAEKAEQVKRLVGDLGDDPMRHDGRMLSWDELREMTRSGWEIGSHTVNHKILTRVSIAEAQHEIAISKEMLESKLEKPIDLFAYPNGKAQDFNVEVQNVLRTSGYSAAATTFDGFNDSSTDLFEIRRHSVWDKHLPSFATRLHRSYLNASESHR
jgi:peptidoglycan/xylan/chitin deacetylase (PgdA/CDA1 family)